MPSNDSDILSVAIQGDGGNDARNDNDDTSFHVSKLVTVIAHIDKQMPSLTYLGFACWIAWNSAAFSGTAWLFDQSQSNLIEELMAWHLVFCAVASVIFGLTSKWSMHLVAKNWFTWLGAIVACVGTALIVGTRFDPFRIPQLFGLGCALSGVGTTCLFMRAVPLLGALPPRRALLTLIGCELFASALYFMMASYPSFITGAAFIALPLLSALFYSLRASDVFGEEEVLHEQKPFSWRFGIFVISVAFCGFGLDLSRSYLLVNLAPTQSVYTAVTQNILMVVLLAILGAAILLASPTSSNAAKRLYSTSVAALALVMATLVVLVPQSVPAAVLTKTIQGVFNMAIWAMLAYIVYQSRSNALSVFSWGNFALCIGSISASVLSYSYFDGQVSEDVIRLLLGLLCVCVLAVVLVVFSGKNLDRLLLPIEEGRLAPVPASDAQEPENDGARKGRWMQRCETIAQNYKLSPREQVVFIALAKGLTPQQIADRECVSIHTVRSQARSIHIKMDVHSKSELDELVTREMDILDNSLSNAD